MKTLRIRFLQFDKNDVNLKNNSKMNHEIFGFYQNQNIVKHYYKDYDETENLHTTGAIDEEELNDVLYAIFHDICESSDRVVTNEPLDLSTVSPTRSHSDVPTDAPSRAPTFSSTVLPTPAPTGIPKDTPTNIPTDAPTQSPAPVPSLTPDPTDAPTRMPFNAPTRSPTRAPTKTTTGSPTPARTRMPTHVPTDSPTPMTNTKSISSTHWNTY